MTFGSRVITAAAALFVAAFCLRAGTAAQASPERPEQSQGREGGPEYLGSKACQACHEASMEQWERSLHVHMTKPVAEATIVGNFSDGTRFADHGRSYQFGNRAGKPFIRIAAADRPTETFPVDYTLGFKRYQGYLSTLPDGRIYVLPAFWQVESGRWIDWKELAPVPDGAHDLRQIWNTNCFNCHATNLAQGFDVATKRYNSTWTEMGIGCEGCHGPGRDHVALMDAWKKDPTSKPPFDIKIFSPRRASSREVFDSCAYCHGNKTNLFAGFRPGERYEDYALPFLISAPIPENDPQGEFWPDGRPNRFNRPQAVMQSGCFESGQLACTNCHVAHGSSNPFSLKVDITTGRNGDRLCTQCHTTPLDTHTFHKPESEGSRCIGCHMSDVNWRLLIRRRDHTYRPPVPEMTAKFGVPNACTTCHDNRTPEWAAAQMDVWWGDGERRKAVVSMAETMYRAGSRDPSVVPQLARLAIDRAQSAFVRASAADYLSKFMIDAGGGAASADPTAVQSQTSFAYRGPAAAPRALAPFEITPAIVNALIGAASDPEPIVRAAAVRGLGVAPDPQRVLSPLTARLVDQTRVVRARAAESLMALGITHLPDAPGGALARAQNEYAASLRSFPDVAGNHAAIAWLEAQRGNLPEALRAADQALHVEPRYARPWVIKGVIFAREGKYGDAVEAWKKARAIEPAYPNIEKLIKEAERLKK